MMDKGEKIHRLDKIICWARQLKDEYDQPVPAPESQLKVGDWAITDNGSIGIVVKGSGVQQEHVWLMLEGEKKQRICCHIGELTPTSIEPRDCVRHRKTGELMIVGNMLGILSDEILITHVQSRDATRQWKLDDCILMDKGPQSK